MLSPKEGGGMDPSQLWDINFAVFLHWLIKRRKKMNYMQMFGYKYFFSQIIIINISFLILLNIYIYIYIYIYFFFFFFFAL